MAEPTKRDEPKTLPIAEALKERSIQAIDATGIIERELRSFAKDLKAELREQIETELLEPLRAVARVLADQAADRDRPPEEKPLMDLKELKALLNWSESKIRREIEAGRFPKPVTPKGKKQQWKRKDVMRTIQGG